MQREQHHTNSRSQGFTLVELLMVIAIGGILLTVAVFTLQTSVDNARLRGATEALQGDLQYAQNLAINNNQPVYVTLTTGANWCYALSDTSGCDCSSTICTVNGVQQANDANSYTNVNLTSGNISGELKFENVHGSVETGISSSPATFTLTSVSSKTSKIYLTQQGKVDACSNDLTGYIAC
jgi:prepilin-type N-terminal cleavage/methylation domain-containing protein